MYMLSGLCVLGWIAAVGSIPFPQEASRSVDTGFIARGTNELATALLQGYVQKEENMVYSPFGYSAILAIFSEGARGVSREEIANALYFPSDVTTVREAYQSVLERFVGKKFSNTPEFKNWFYIYKNYTVEEELQNILRKYYLTEVKYVESPEEYIKNTKTSPIKESIEPVQKIDMDMSKLDAKMQDKNNMEMTKTDPDMTKAQEMMTPNQNVDMKMPQTDSVSTKTQEMTDKVMAQPESMSPEMKSNQKESEMTKTESKTSEMVKDQMTEEIMKPEEMTKTEEMMKPETMTKTEEMLKPDQTTKTEVMKPDQMTKTEEMMKPDQMTKTDESMRPDQMTKTETMKEETMETLKMVERSAADGKENVAAEGNSKYKGAEEVKSVAMEKDMDIKEKKEEVTMAPIKTSAEMGVMPVENFSGMTDSSLTIKGKDFLPLIRTEPVQVVDNNVRLDSEQRDDANINITTFLMGTPENRLDARVTRAREKLHESKPRMVIFNGLYYKGEWESPFVKRAADDSRVFYKSDKEKIFVSTIHSEGVFNYGSITNLDCKAIELPYKGGRYSLLILVPNTRNGLSKLISDLSGYNLKNVYGQLSEKLVEVCLPCFEINTISKPISAPNKMGLTKVTSIFKPETADLSGISTKDSGLFVEELVQMVTFKVDANYSKTNFLTASIASSRSNVQSFQVNQPFLFYLRDNLQDIIIVNGKVIDPTPKPNFYFS